MEREQRERLFQWITILFYLMVLLAGVAYLWIPNRVWFYSLGFGAIGVRIVTYILRRIL